MSTRTNATNHHYAQHHRGTEVVPFDNVLGITPDGVPVMSNGDESYFSNMVSLVPGCIGLSSSQRRCPCKLSHTTTGYRWQCVEFVRRYLAARKAVWMSSIATAEDAWTCETLFTSVVNNAPVGFTKMANNSVSPMPSVGDVIVWSRCEAVPFGHMAIVTNVRDEKVYVAEQNQGFERWTSDMPYSRSPSQVSRQSSCDGGLRPGALHLSAYPVSHHRFSLPNPRVQATGASSPRRCSRKSRPLCVCVCGMCSVDSRRATAAIWFCSEDL